MSYYMSSIDGRFAVLPEARSVGTPWNDNGFIPIFRHGDNAWVGQVDPDTGSVEWFPEPKLEEC